MKSSRAGRWFARRLLFAFSTFFFLLPPPVEATRVRSLNLEEMTHRAGTILSGRCVDVRVMRDPDLEFEVTLITLNVARTIKGRDRRTMTFKMLGAADQGSTRGRSVPGMPGFRRGQEVVLFLYGESASGLTSPVGLGQGKFTVIDQKGRPVALNAFGNKALFRGLSVEATDSLGDLPQQWRGQGGIPLDTLLSMVEKLNPAIKSLPKQANPEAEAGGGR